MADWKKEEQPLLYYKTKEQIEEYRKKPVELKLRWLEEQMQFFYYAMPEKAKIIREKLMQKKKYRFKDLS
ncbi:MAG: hypothetical protein NZ809_05385 [Thermodesulfovibrio sp.]|nr:hypothetical protein [Thermodesulfovibrio sp.]